MLGDISIRHGIMYVYRLMINTFEFSIIFWIHKSAFCFLIKDQFHQQMIHFLFGNIKGYISASFKPE